MVAVVETTKAAVEVECWQEGTVGELLVPVGQTVQVGTSLATLLEPREAEAAPAHPRTSTTPAAETAAPSAPPPAATTHPAAARQRRWVSPAAHRLAESTGVDVEILRGTGPQGAVTIHDVENATASTEDLAGNQTATGDRATQMRQSIAAAMSRSKREIPHYYLVDEVMMDNALAWLTQCNAQRPITERLLPAVPQLKAVALAAQQFSEFNRFWLDGAFQSAAAVHVGVAITLRGGGLVAPAIHDVANKKLDELMSELTDLVTHARSGSLRSSEMSDPTLTVTNRGDRGSARSSASSTHRKWRSSASANRPSGSSRSMVESGSPPPSKPPSPPTTGPATAIRAPCFWPQSTSCSSSPTFWRGEQR